MDIRGIVVTGAVLGSTPFCFLHPWIGILLWSWISYMNPHRLTWGFAYNFPFAFIISIATFSGLVFTRDRRHLPRFREVWLLCLLWLTFVLSTKIAAIYPADAARSLDRVSKILIMTFLTIFLIQDRHRLRLLLLVIAFSLGFFGLKGGVFTFLTGGRYRIYGPPGSFIEGNNELGLALNMILPILWFLRVDERRAWLRHLLLAVFWFSVVAIIATYSRGALLGLSAVMGMLFWKSRNRIWILLFILLASSIAVNFMPDQWLERMGTIETFREDGSAMGRITAWKLSMRIAADRPILGAGFRPFTKETSLRYLPDEPAHERDAHNIFFQILAEHGLVGLSLYALLIGMSFASLRGIQKRCRRLGDLDWLITYARMIEVSLVGYVVTGFFLSLCYFDLYFHLVAITIILREILRIEIRGRLQDTAPAVFDPAGRSLPEPAGA